MAETLNAIASLLWPLLALVALLLFRRPLARLVRSAERREWTLEVGGQRLTMKELSEQQANLIADLQAQLARLQHEVDRRAAADEPLGTSGPQTPGYGEPQSFGGADPGYYGDRPFAVLWVDDRPENNALLVEQLQRNGVRVDTVRSTSEALRRFGHRRYRAIVSDLGRREDGTDVPDAGLQLLRAVRARDTSIPFLIYTNGPAVQAIGGQALAEGATEITASPYQLTESLRTLELL